VFDYGKDKSDSKAKDYPGARESASIAAYALSLVEKADIEPEIYELVN